MLPTVSYYAEGVTHTVATHGTGTGRSGLLGCLLALVVKHGNTGELRGAIETVVLWLPGGRRWKGQWNKYPIGGCEATTSLRFFPA